MSVIHTCLSPSQVRRLSQRDNDYLKQKLKVKCALNNLLSKPINRPLLAELRCVLDSKPIPRRKTEQYNRHSKVRVYNADGVLIRIEHSNGKARSISINERGEEMETNQVECNVAKKKDEVIINEPFYYPHTSKWYQFTDHRVDGELISRVCKEVKAEP